MTTPKTTTTKKTKTAVRPEPGTERDPQSVTFCGAEIDTIARALIEYEGHADLSDGAITLPALRVFAARHHFKRSMESLSAELRVLRGRFDRGRVEPELEPMTLTGAVLESLSSYFSCVAEDGVWCEDTFGGLRSNIETELERGVTVEELRDLKEWSDDAGATPTPSAPVVPIGALNHIADGLRATSQRDLMAQQGFPAVKHDETAAAVRDHMAGMVSPAPIAWTSPPCEHHSKLTEWVVKFQVDEDETRAVRTITVLAKDEDDARVACFKAEAHETRHVTIKSVFPPNDAPAERVKTWRASTKTEHRWVVYFTKVPTAYHTQEEAIVTARTAREAKEIVSKAATETIIIADAIPADGVDIFDNVCLAMQEADEMGGVASPDEYVTLMERIAAEAMTRAAACRANASMKEGK